MYNTSNSHSHAVSSVYKVGKITVHGATQKQINQMDLDDNTLVINCGAYSETICNPYKKVPDGMLLPGIDMAARNIHELWLDWPDFGKPPITVDTWKKLFSETKRMKFKNVVFCCTGGHGRTGTALSSFLICLGKKTAKEAVESVRKAYCEEAVESSSQENYLCDLAFTVNGGEREEPQTLSKAKTYTTNFTAASTTPKQKKYCQYCKDELTGGDVTFKECGTCWSKFGAKKAATGKDDDWTGYAG